MNRQPWHTRALGLLSTWLVTALIGCASLAGAAESGAPDPGQKCGVTGTEVVIGACEPMSGPLAWRGRATEHAVRTYFNDINDHGGIAGRKVKFVVCDDAYNPDKAMTCFSTCLKDKVFAVGFLTGSAPCAKYVRMGDITKTPVLGFLVGTPAIYDFRPSQFVMRPSYVHEAEREIKELCQTHKVKNIALIYQNDALGAGIRDGVIKSLSAYHLAPVAEASFSRATNDPQTALEKVASAKPEAIIMALASQGISPAMDWRTRTNSRAVFLAYSPQLDAIVKSGANAEGVLVTQVLPPADEKFPCVAQYHKLLKKYYPSDTPDLVGLEAFANCQVMAEGLRRAGRDLTRAGFVAALEGLKDFDVGLGPEYEVNYSHTNHVGWTAGSVHLSEMKGGKLVPASEAEIGKLVDNARGR